LHLSASMVVSISGPGSLKEARRTQFSQCSQSQLSTLLSNTQRSPHIRITTQKTTRRCGKLNSRWGVRFLRTRCANLDAACIATRLPEPLTHASDITARCLARAITRVVLKRAMVMTAPFLQTPIQVVQDGTTSVTEELLALQLQTQLILEDHRVSKFIRASVMYRNQESDAVGSVWARWSMAGSCQTPESYYMGDHWHIISLGSRVCRMKA
jgi:hypothetical protein